MQELELAPYCKGATGGKGEEQPVPQGLSCLPPLTSALCLEDVPCLRKSCLQVPYPGW